MMCVVMSVLLLLCLSHGRKQICRLFITFLFVVVVFCVFMLSTFIVDRFSAGGGCEAAVTVRTGCGWFMFMECGELLYGRRFPLMLKWVVDESKASSTVMLMIVRPAVL